MTVKTINAEEFVTLAKQHKPTIIDLRTPAEHESEHLTNSTLLPVSEIDHKRLDACLSEPTNEASTVYLLCQSGKRAEMACEKLQGCAHELVIITGGLNALKAAGIETASTGRQTISLERQVRICAGALVLLAGILGFTVHHLFFAVSTAIGAGLLFAGITDTCAMGIALMRMPWNQQSSSHS